MRFRGKLVDANGQIIADNITGDLDVRSSSPGGAMGWSGRFTVSANVHVPQGRWRLILDDGRSGTVMLHGLNPGSTGTSVDFTGDGPLA